MHYKIDLVTNTLRSIPDTSHSEGEEEKVDTMGRANGATIIEWDWDAEHKDRKREKASDAAVHDARYPFDVDRRVLKDVVREQMGEEVGRIRFLNSGTFHKAYLVTLRHGQELVARVARRFMPRLKTESEVATMRYLQKTTHVPVPTVFHYDSNPYNRLGGEWILMSKAPGIPLSQVFHSMPHSQLIKLLDNLALLILSLFSHRFPQLGSLYFGPPPSDGTSQGTTPKAVPSPYTAFPFSPTLAFSSHGETPRPLSAPKRSSYFQGQDSVVHIGPIISWPFFGSNRGDLAHPTEINRGPWFSSQTYFDSCAKREIDGVIRENEGKAAPHKLHLDPAEIRASIHHHMKAVPGDTSDDSDEWDLEESEDEWEGPGDAMYRDYRRMQRSTFLVAHLNKRHELVLSEMQRWKTLMDKLINLSGAYTGKEEFGLDAHDLSLENIFVDTVEHSKITCIIDWESTTTRPLWACAHIPAFLDSSAFTADLFRQAIKRVASPLHHHARPPAFKNLDMPALAREWVHWESAGTHLRMAHRFVEWDGWEEGLIDEILGPPEAEEEWLKLTQSRPSVINGTGLNSTSSGGSPVGPLISSFKRQPAAHEDVVRRASSALPFVVNQKAKVSVLNTTGDYCGGRGGELGRRLEAWLHVSETKAPKVVASRKKWAEEEYEGGAESD